MTARVDHLVIAARTLDEGVRWCEETLGVAPGPGGAHPLMGTHNRLLPIASDAFPQAYLEIIAIDPAVQPARAAPLRRWFDLDDAGLQDALTRNGPQLIHFVAAVSDVESTVRTLASETLGIDRGRVIEASRDAPDGSGRLEWQITVRDDGQRLFYGTLPTLIHWAGRHPTEGMPDAGLALISLEAAHPRVEALRTALDAIGMADLPVRQGPPDLVATLQTPRGIVTLSSSGRASLHGN